MSFLKKEKEKTDFSSKKTKSSKKNTHNKPKDVIVKKKTKISFGRKKNKNLEKDFTTKEIVKEEVEKVKKSSQEFIRFMIEHIQRKRGMDVERTKIRVKYGDKYGEILLLEKNAYIIHDIDQEEKEISKAEITSGGGLGKIKKSSFEELEKELSKIEILSKVFIKEPIFEDMKKIFGKNVEILINY